MDRTDVAYVLAYLAADYNHEVTDQQIAVWLNQFAHIEKRIAMLAARICAARKSYGFPHVHDFHKAIEEVITLSERNDWGRAWDLWVKIARRGRYFDVENVAFYRKVCPMGADALGTMSKDYYDIPDAAAMNTLRAQFRQRFESLQSRERAMQTLPPSLIQEIRQIGAERGAIIPEGITKRVSDVRMTDVVPYRRQP